MIITVKPLSIVNLLLVNVNYTLNIIVIELYTGLEENLG